MSRIAHDNTLETALKNSREKATMSQQVEWPLSGLVFGTLACAGYVCLVVGYLYMAHLISL